MKKGLFFLLLVALTSVLLFAAKEAKHTIDKEKCIGCKLCVPVCPTKAITMKGKKAVIDPEKCINCGLCVKKCPTQAISPPKKKVSSKKN